MKENPLYQLSRGRNVCYILAPQEGSVQFSIDQLNQKRSAPRISSGHTRPLPLYSQQPTTELLLTCSSVTSTSLLHAWPS